MFTNFNESDRYLGIGTNTHGYLEPYRLALLVLVSFAWTELNGLLICFTNLKIISLGKAGSKSVKRF